jgi:hypothetical protein
MIFSIISTGLGLAFAVYLVANIYKRDAIHWQYLEQAYGRPWQPPLRERWASAVLYGKHPFSKAYNGILKMGVHKDGVSFRVMFPLISYFCKPLFIPYRDIRGWNQTWYLNAKTVELELSGAPEVKIAMPRDQVEWIRTVRGKGISLINKPSPHNAKPKIWHAYIIVSSTVMIVTMLYILVKGPL